MKNVVIIGAGPAGLTAAYQLLKSKHGEDTHVILLEESAHIGGISRTAEHHGNRMDLGGHRFFSKNAQVNALWQEIMPLQGAPAMDDRLLGRERPLAPGGPDPEKDERVMLVRQRVSRIFFLRKFFDYPISMKPQTFINMGFPRTVKAGLGYIYSSLRKREENSLEDFYINRFGRPLYEMFFEDYTHKLWGVHPSKIAPDWGAQRVKGLSLRKALLSAITKPFKKKDAQVETSLIEQFSYPKRGPGQLWEAMAQDVTAMGGDLRMHARASKIERNDAGQITAVVYTHMQTGEQVTLPCDAVFSSMPIKDLFEAMDNTPKDVHDIAVKLPYRDFITVGLLVNKLAITNTTKLKTLSNIVPDCWIYIQERDVRIGRLQVFNNWSPYMVSDPENTVWIGLEYFCDEGDAMWSMDDDAFIAMATQELIKIGILDADASILDNTRLRVKKAYPAYFGAYARMDDVRSYLNTIDNLYCIGRNGQHRYNNMDHSMLTAIEGVSLYHTGNPDKSSLWKINTEESYHEEGKNPATPKKEVAP